MESKEPNYLNGSPRMDTFDELTKNIKDIRKKLNNTSSEVFIEFLDEYCDSVINKLSSSYVIMLDLELTTCQTTKQPCLLYKVTDALPSVLTDQTTVSSDPETGDITLTLEDKKFQVIKERLETAVGQLFPMMDHAVNRTLYDPTRLIIKLYRKDPVEAIVQGKDE